MRDPLSLIMGTIVAWTMVVSSGACGPPGTAGGDLTVWGSAGIRIVENAADLDDRPTFARVGPVERSIGVVEGSPEYVFGQIRRVRALPDGGVVVAAPTGALLGSASLSPGFTVHEIGSVYALTPAS